MNRLIILMILLIVFSSCKSKNDKNKEQFYYVTDNLIDIGKVRQKDSSFAKFKIINISDEDIVVSHLVSSCHCTAPNYNKKPIKSLDTLEIDVIYDNHILGFFEQTISVYFENKEMSPLLIMRGNIIN